jgi:Family of unknown function (DUF6624)
MKEKIPSKIELFSGEIRLMHEKDQAMRKRALNNDGVIESDEDDTLDRNDIKRMNSAYLEDRIRINEGEPQLYGTQFFGEGENYGPRPIEDLEHVDERRKAAGMESLAEYTKMLKEKYNV